MVMDPFNAFADVNEPPLEAPPTQAEKLAKLTVKGATLGLKNRDVQAQSLLEHAAEMTGSLAPIAAISAVASPAVGIGLRAASLPAGALATRLVGAGATGLVAGGIEGATTEKGPVAGALEGAVTYPLMEAGFLGAGKAISKLRGVAAKEAPKITAAAAETAGAEIKTATTTPVADAVSTLTTKVPETPAMLPLEQRAPMPFTVGEQLPLIKPPKFAEIQPDLPGVNIAKYGPNISADDRGNNIARVTLDSFIDRPATLYQPAMGLESAPLRMELEKRFTPEVLKTAEKMTPEEFAKYATDNSLVASVISNAGATPDAVWRAAQVAKDVATSTKFEPIGRTPAFYEVYDQEMGKKVLVPRERGVAQMLDTLEHAPTPRQLELQLTPEQLSFLKTNEGQGFLRKLDIVKQREPLLTSNVVKKSEEEVARILDEATPFDVVQPTIIKKTEGAARVEELRTKAAITDGELVNMAQAIAKSVKNPSAIEETLARAISARCV